MTEPVGTEIPQHLAESPTPDPKQTARQSAALGWALTELLSRCYALKPLTQQEKEDHIKRWEGKEIQTLPLIRSPRQQIMTLMKSIRILAKQLGLVDTCKIPRSTPTHPDEGDFRDKFYIDAIENDVQQLCSDDCDAARIREFRGYINERLYYWNIKIYDELQGKGTEPAESYAYLNAYQVSRSFAALRWYLGEDGLALPQQNKWGQRVTALLQYVEEDGLVKKDELVSSLQDRTNVPGFIKRLCEHVQLMAPYLPYNHTAIALAYSMKRWGKALLLNRVTSVRDDQVIPELNLQANIWQELLLGERDPVTYVTPSSVAWRYNLKVILLCLPLLLTGLVLAVVVALLILFLLGFLWPKLTNIVGTNTTVVPIITTIGTGLALLAGIGTAFPAVKGLWQWVSKKVQTNVDKGADSAVSTAQISLLDMLWDEAQQEVINKATYVRVRFPLIRESWYRSQGV